MLKYIEVIRGLAEQGVTSDHMTKHFGLWVYHGVGLGTL